MYDCNTQKGQCKINNTDGKYRSLDECHSSCSGPGYTFDCTNNKCVINEAGGGTYTGEGALEKCNDECAKYDCNTTTGQCSPAAQGAHQGLSTCHAACSIPDVKFKCNKATGQCQIDSEGAFSDLDTCHKSCEPPVTQYACNAQGQCKPDAGGEYAGLNECQEECSLPGVKYNCDPKSRQCTVAGDGEGGDYDDLASCNKACGAWYDCDSSNGQCKINNQSGKYKSLEECQSSCTGPGYTFDCTDNKCVINQAGTGKYTGDDALEKCNDECTKYKCDTTTGQCSPDAQGDYTGLSTCHAACSIPAVKFKCNALSGQCQVDSEGAFSDLDTCHKSCEPPVTQFRCNKGKCESHPGGEYRGAEECLDECSLPDVKYMCNSATNQCSPAADGEVGDYDDLASCHKACGATYQCNTTTGQCKLKPGGKYTSLDECHSACSGPGFTFDCDQENNRCKINKIGNGMYKGDGALQTCTDACIKYKCNTAKGQCSPHQSGTYDGLTACHSNCNTPTIKYKCDPTTGQCQIDPTGTHSILDDCHANCKVPFKNFKCNKGKCEQDDAGKYRGLQECVDDCSVPGKKYSCDGASGKCKEDAAGSFDSLATCHFSCNTKYACDDETGQCAINKDGPYSDLDNCHSACQVPYPAYDCDADKNACVHAKQQPGEYSGIGGLARCQDGCPKFKCNEIEGQCVQDKNGEYTGLKDCNDNCESNLRFKCDQTKGQCSEHRAGTYKANELFQCHLACPHPVMNDRFSCDPKRGQCFNSTEQPDCTDGYTPGTKDAPSDSCPLHCTLTVATEDQPETCTATDYGQDYRGLVECTQNCTKPDEVYKCDPESRRCVVGKQGEGVTYNDLVTCAKACKTQYACDTTTGQCLQDSSGAYTNLDACHKACTVPLKNFKCDGDTGQCVQDDAGEYRGMGECNEECSAAKDKFSCNPQTGQCYTDDQGNYATLRECHDKCTTTYKCAVGSQYIFVDGEWISETAGQCVIDDGNKKAPDYTGNFQTLSACQSDCKLPIKNFKCDKGKCTQDDAGGYRGLQECVDNCAIPGMKYDCDDSTKRCVPREDGSFDSLSKCQEGCTTKYVCNSASGQCRADIANGTHDSLSDCHKACGKAKCNGATGQCEFDPTGSYENVSECNKECVIDLDNYRCDESKGMCIKSATGVYRGLEECNDNCENPEDKYECKVINGIKKCRVDSNGQYSDLDTCQQACGQKYKCDTATGQCIIDINGEYDDLDDCHDACGKASCDSFSGRCFYDQENGTFDNMAACSKDCTKDLLNFKCNANGTCSQDDSGDYRGLVECDQNCFPPSAKFSCVNSKCVRDDTNGNYSTLALCQKACKINYACDTATGQCQMVAEDIGDYTDLDQCHQNCQIPIQKYRCNSSSGQCIKDDTNGSFNGLTECNEQCSNLNKEYNCDATTKSCTAVDDGQYSSLSLCQTGCQVKYECDSSNGQCVIDNVNGRFTALEECHKNCSPPGVTYNCDSNTKLCSINTGSGAGQFDSLSKCQTGCETKFSCNTATGQCSASSNGDYDDLGECHRNCTVPDVVFRCNGATGQCEIKDTTRSNQLATDYTDIDQCNTACDSPAYSCDSTGQCTPADGGPFNSLQNCTANCTADVTYSCDSATGQCKEDAAGSFDSIDTCHSTCNPPGVTYACDSTFNRCYPYDNDKSGACNDQAIKTKTECEAAGKTWTAGDEFTTLELCYDTCSGIKTKWSCDAQTGQCRANPVSGTHDTLSDCNSACSVPGKTYDCNTETGQCQDKGAGGGGEYTGDGALQRCHDACVLPDTLYKCDTATGQCVVDLDNGTYNSLGTCNTNCSPPGQNFKCDFSTGQCSKDDNGPYSNLTNCNTGQCSKGDHSTQADCEGDGGSWRDGCHVKYNCDDATFTCSPAADGTFGTLQSCQNECDPPEQQWNCVDPTTNPRCEAAPLGQDGDYDTLRACQQGCRLNFACNSATGQCSKSDNGPYNLLDGTCSDSAITTKTACEAAGNTWTDGCNDVCDPPGVNYNCSARLHKCEVATDGKGKYPTLAGCNAECNPPERKYLCNTLTGMCEISDSAEGVTDPIACFRDCDPPGQEYNCDGASGKCVPVDNGSFGSLESCNTSCDKTADDYWCFTNAQGLSTCVADKAPTPAPQGTTTYNSLAACTQACDTGHKYSCDPHLHRCFMDPGSGPHDSLASCTTACDAGMVYGCNAATGTCSILTGSCDVPSFCTKISDGSKTGATTREQCLAGDGGAIGDDFRWTDTSSPAGCSNGQGAWTNVPSGSCSDPAITNKISCEGAGNTWTLPAGQYSGSLECQAACEKPEKYNCEPDGNGNARCKQASVGQDGAYDSLPQCQENCGNRYDCNEREGSPYCFADGGAGTGQYATVEECHDKCYTPSYKCTDWVNADTDRCQPIKPGSSDGTEYNRKMDCTSVCPAPHPLYNCDQESGQCVEAPKGRYGDLTECSNSCWKANCDLREYKDHFDSNGDWDQRDSNRGYKCRPCYKCPSCMSEVAICDGSGTAYDVTTCAKTYTACGMDSCVANCQDEADCMGVNIDNDQEDLPHCNLNHRINEAPYWMNGWYIDDGFQEHGWGFWSGYTRKCKFNRPVTPLATAAEAAALNQQGATFGPENGSAWSNVCHFDRAYGPAG